MKNIPPLNSLLKMFLVDMAQVHESRNLDRGYDLLILSRLSANDFEVALGAVCEMDWGPSWRTIEVLEFAGHKSRFREQALAMLETLTESGNDEVRQLAAEALARIRRGMRG